MMPKKNMCFVCFRLDQLLIIGESTNLCHSKIIGYRKNMLK